MSNLGFRRGAEEAEKSNKGGNWSKAHFLELKDKESIVVRFISDHTDWLTVDQHQMIPTKPKPEGYEGNWPEKMGAVCRNTKMAGDPPQPMFGDCYICANIVDGKKVKRPSGRTWAIACIREEVIGDGSDALGGEAMKGKRVGYRDATREVTKPKDGATKGADGKYAEEDMETGLEKALIFVNQGYKNFFGTLKGFAGHYGTICDRDMKITRSGTEKDTDYSIIPLDPIPVAGGGVLDTRNPEHLKRYGFNTADEVWDMLTEQVADRASEKFYARFFDRTKTLDKDGNVVAASAAEQAVKPENDSSGNPERLAALAGRIQGYAPTDGAPEAQAPAPPSQDTQADAPAPAAPAQPVTAGAPMDLG